MIAFDAIKFVTTSPINQPFTLNNGYVSPSSGDTSTTFSYYVTYSDPEGDLPTLKYVYIDYSPNTMVKISGDYVSGAVFRYSTTLSVGSHNYYFSFEDSVHGHTKSLPPSGTYPGPNVPPPDFSITSSPTSLTIQKGSSGTSAITVTSMNGFNQPVQLTKSGVPSGVTAALNPQQVTPPAGGSTTSTLTVSVSTTATPGSYTLTVTGTSGALTHSTYISLEVTSAPPPPNQPPNAPAFVFQFRTDLTQIPVGETTVENTVVFKGVVSDPDGDSVSLQVELRNLNEYNGEFNETAEQFKESGLVLSGSEAIALAHELNDHFYHWRARAVDEHGNKSEWVDFGDNSIYWTDFAVDTTPPETYILSGPEEGAILSDNDVVFRVDGWDKITSYLDLLYSYRLEGYDPPEVWSDWKHSDVWGWKYTALPNGEYTFMVKAKDEAGYIDPTPAERSFAVSITGPHIDKIDPASGAPGIEVKITGLNLDRQFMGWVDFGGDTTSVPESWTDTEIVMRVPHGEGVVDVKVVIDISYESNAIPFTYNNPHIDSITPSSGRADEAVKITGADFGNSGPLELGFYVKFGKSIAVTTEWTDNEIAAKPPSDFGTGENDRNRLILLLTLAYYGWEGLVDDAMKELGEKLLEDLLKEGVRISVAERRVEVDVRVFTPTGEPSNSKTFTYIVNEVTLSSLLSPGELRMYDSQGRVTGLVDGQVMEEIPYSYYVNNSILVVYSSDSYRFEIVGNAEGTYGLNVTYGKDGETASFFAHDIPMLPGQIHNYTIDWAALSLGEEGVTVEVDSDGNGVPEYTFTSDSELTQNEFLIQTGQSALYTFSIVWGEETFIVSVESNSTVSNFAFSPGTKSLSFTVNGTSGPGFCNVTIPKALLHAAPSDWIVLIDGVPLPPYAVTLTENATHNCLYFTYAHSTHVIQMMGTWVIGPPTLPLSVSISPLSASLVLGQSVTFTSAVSGGVTPYGYQWYVNSALVPSATSASWTFTPSTSGIYYVYLKATDASTNASQSETARIVVVTVPVGGYSIAIGPQTKAEPVLPYIALIAALTAVFTKLRPKTKRKR
jgi:hypothetical protein